MRPSGTVIADAELAEICRFGQALEEQDAMGELVACFISPIDSS